VRPSDRFPRKVHLIGPLTAGGFFRTLCEHNISATMNATADKESVTCAICVWRMQRIDQGMERASEPRCPHGDLSCPCPDGLLCHYSPPDAMRCPTTGLIDCLECLI
jgi:hypothetical protein